MQEDTIAAISTPNAAGGIGIVRISGKDAIRTAQKIFTAKNGKLLSEMKPYTAAYGKAVKDGEIIDECIALLFRAPKSYTGEDVVELSCHGGVYVMRKVLQAALLAGARMAEPGEFTKRAFLNAKIDLTQAESIMDIITAQSDRAVKAAQNQHEGALFKEILQLREQLVEIASAITAWVDFPEEDTPALEMNTLKSQLYHIEKKIKTYINGFESGRVLREGLDTVIAGKPNAGKSTIMNLLSGCERSIVTDIPGTTRDVIEDIVRVGDTVLRISDTAGIHETNEKAEKIGVERAKKRLGSCDLILAVFDSSIPLDEDDEMLIKSLKNKKTIAILNKTDLAKKINEEILKEKFEKVVSISAKTWDGFLKLKKEIEKTAGTGKEDLSQGMLANQRQLQCAIKAENAVESGLRAIKEGITLDAVSVCIDDAISALSELTGESASQSVIERVFERFCVGK